MKRQQSLTFDQFLAKINKAVNNPFGEGEVILRSMKLRLDPQAIDADNESFSNAVIQLKLGLKLLMSMH